MNSISFLEVPLERLDQVAEKIFDFGKEYKVWLLEGNMGAGKTTFVKALSKTLRINNTISSPTFSIVNEYSSNILGKVYHFDCYRLNGIEEAYDIGLEEYIDSNHLCLIEWADKIKEILPPKFLKVEINLYNSTQRNFLVTQNG